MDHIICVRPLDEAIAHVDCGRVFDQNGVRDVPDRTGILHEQAVDTYGRHRGTVGVAPAPVDFHHRLIGTRRIADAACPLHGNGLDQLIGRNTTWLALSCSSAPGPDIDDVQRSRSVNTDAFVWGALYKKVLQNGLIP